MAFDKSWLQAFLSVVLLPVDRDEMDDTLGLFWLTASSSTGLVVACGCFFDCHSTFWYRASCVIETLINSKHQSFVV